MTTGVLPNGVNATAVVAYATRLQEDAPADGTSFQAEVHWRGGFRNEIVVRDLPPTYADEPEVLGGTNTAANPVEQILGALGACLAIGYTAGATARGITIDDLRIDLTGNIDLPVFFGLKAGHAGYEGIDAKVSSRPTRRARQSRRSTRTSSGPRRWATRWSDRSLWPWSSPSCCVAVPGPAAAGRAAGGAAVVPPAAVGSWEATNRVFRARWRAAAGRSEPSSARAGVGSAWAGPDSPRLATLQRLRTVQNSRFVAWQERIDRLASRGPSGATNGTIWRSDRSIPGTGDGGNGRPPSV